MLFEPENDTFNIVLLGNFNPSICRPSWLCKYGLISENEQESVSVVAQNQEIAIYEFETFKFQLFKNKFSIESSIIYDFKILDFVVSLFSSYLPHTPCTKLGINRNVHFDTGSIDARTRIGRKLAPLAPWGSWGETIDGKTPDKISGLTNLTMKETSPDDRENGHIQVTVAPSGLVKASTSGVYVQVNNEYSLSDEQIKNEDNTAFELVEILKNQFEDSKKVSIELINIVMELSNE